MKTQLISHARSGSTYLYDVIYRTIFASNPHTFVFNEPFNMSQRKLRDLSDDEKDFLLQSRLEKLVKLPHVYQKSHIHHYNFLNTRQMEYYKTSEWYNIFLYRRDLFESTMSQVISDKTKMWIRYEELDRPPLITSRDFARVLKVQIEAREELFNLKYFVPNEIVIYEDLVFVRETDYESLAISEIIGPFVSGKELVERAPDKKEIVSNYDQLLDQYYKTVKDMTFENFELDGRMITATRLEEAI